MTGYTGTGYTLPTLTGSVMSSSSHHLGLGRNVRGWVGLGLQAPACIIKLELYCKYLDLEININITACPISGL